MPAQSLPLHPGDVIRVDRGFPRRRVDEDVVDFLRIYFDNGSSGLGHVLEVRDDGIVISLWGIASSRLSWGPATMPSA